MKALIHTLQETSRLWMFFAVWFASQITVNAQSITTGTVNPAPLCSGTAFTVPFSWNSLGTGTHTFQVELSNASGSFSSGTTALLPTASVSGSNNAGTYMVVDIPQNVSAGTGYRVRVRRISGSPVNGSASSNNITIREAFNGVSNLFSENMGSVASSTIATHESNNRFQNGAQTMSGSGSSVVTSNASSGYSGASGGSSVFLDGNGETFIIAGINTSSRENLRLRFGVRPGASNTDFDDLVVEVSDGGTAPWYRHEFTQLGTNNTWYLRSTEGTIPATTNLHIRFTQAVGGSNNFRIDDVVLTYGTSSTAVALTPAVDQTVCPGTAVNFSVTSLTGATYLWSNTATTNSISPTTPTNYSVTVTDASGCIISRGPVALINHPASVGGSTSGAATVCSLGNSGTITLSGQTGNVVRWESSTNGGTSWSTIANTGTSQNFTNLTASTLYRAVVSNEGCAEAVSSATQITVTTAPAAAVSITADNTTVCAGTKVSFAATPTNGGTTPSYQWRKNGSNVGTNLPFYIEANPNNGDIFDVVMTSSETCVLPATATSSTVSIIVNPFLTPSVSIAASSTQICTGSPITFTATPVNGGTTPAYQWKLNGNNVGSNSSTYTSSSLANNDQVSVEMISSYACLPVSNITNANWPDDEPSNIVYGILKQNDGKYMVSGEFTSVGGTTRRRVARLNADGSLDASFATGSGFQGAGTDWVNEVEQQADGKYICVGNFDDINGVTRNNIVRLNNNGTLDNTFNVGSGANDQVWTAVIQPDGKVVIGGHFTSYNGTTRRRVARINTDGSLDAFNPNCNDDVAWIEMQPDGKFIIVGDFTTVSGVGRNRVARVNADGTLDNSFDPGSGANDVVYSVKIQSDGKIVIGGSFTSFNGTTVNRVVRLNTDGSIDNTFNAGSGANARITMLEIDNHQKVYLGGDFSQVNGITRNNIARLNSNGSLDNTYTLTSGGVNNTTWIMKAEPGGRLNIGGSFTNALGTSRDHLISTGPAVASNSITITVNGTTVPGTASGTATVCEGANTGNINLSGNNGSVIRWESSTNGGVSWNTIANTSNSQSYLNLTQTTRFRAVVANGVCNEATSNAIIVTVNTPTVAGTVNGSTTVCQTGNSGSVNLSGQTGSILNWQTSTNGGTSWSTLASTNATQNYSGLSATTLYRAVVQSGVCPSAFSTPATITVNPNTVAGSTSGAATVCAGSNSGSINLNGQVGSVVRWQTSPNGSSWTDVSNVTTSIAYSNLTSTTHYRAVVQSGVCPQANSTISIVTVNANTVAGSVTSDATVCASSNSGTLNLSGQVGSVQLWQSSINGGASWSSITNTTTSQSYTNLTQTTLYRAVVRSGVCPALESTIATITVNPATNAGITSGATTVCENTNSGSISLSGQVGAIIQWQTSPNGSSWSNVANTSNSITYTNLTTTTHYRAVVQSGVCPQANSNVSIVTVNPNTVGGMVGSDASVCASGNSGTLNLTGNTGTVQIWQSSVNGGASWSSIPNTSLSQGYINLNQTTLYRAVVQSGVCPAIESAPATITVSQTPIGGTVNSSLNACSGTNNGVLNLVGYSGIIEKWQSSPNGTAWTDIANTTDSQNFSGLTATTHYRAVVDNGPCASVNAVSAIVTIIPSSNGGTVSTNQDICADENALPVSVSGQNGSVIRWEKSNEPTFAAPSSILTGGTTLSTFLMGALGDDNYFRAIVQQTGNGCLEAPSSAARVQVFDLPTVSISGDASLCAGSAFPDATLNSNALPVDGTIANVIWRRNAGLISGENATTLTTSLTGTYTAQVFNSFGCHATSAPFTVSPREFNVSVNAGANGSFSAPATITCGDNGNINILADECYLISEVTVNGITIIDENNNQTGYTLVLTDVREDQVIDINFALRRFNLSAEVLPTPGTFATITNAGIITRDCGSNVSYSITVDACTDLDNVIINGIGIGPQFNFSIDDLDQTTSIFVVVSQKSYSINATAGAGGSISPAGIQTYGCGENATYIFVPDAGFGITGVSVNGVPVGALVSYTFSNIQQNHTIEVNFAPVPQNNNWVQYQPTITTNLPSCITAAGTLAGCTPSIEAAYVSHPVGSGQDAWYRFRVPDVSSGIVRIRANSVFNNLSIVLQKEETVAPFYTPVAVENAVNGIGEEIMTATNLVPGAFYRVAIKNMGLEAANAFNICVINVRPTTCGTFSSNEFPLSLCSNFNAGYSAAKSYTFTFRNVSDPSNVITRTTTGAGNSPASTLILLRTPGFRYGATYDVQIAATHEFVNGAGVSQQMIVDGGIQTCQAVIGPQPQAAIAVPDRCTNSPKRTSYVLSADWICGIIDYQWEVTPTIGLPVPYLTRRNFPERFMRIGNLNGINAGGSNFMIRVRPIFADGQGGEFFGQWGPAHEICLVTGLSTQGQEEVIPAEQESPSIEANWSIYPNPNNGETLYLTVPGEAGKQAEMRIMDAMGRTVFTRTLGTGEDVQSVSLPAAITNGLYMVEVRSGEDTFKKRLIINK